MATMTSLGMISLSEGHVMQFEGLWDRLDEGRSRFVLGQWGHSPPTGFKDGWEQQVVQWFDHYLRGGPQGQQPGVVEYEDDALRWHQVMILPPLATRDQTLRDVAEHVMPLMNSSA